MIGSIFGKKKRVPTSGEDKQSEAPAPVAATAKTSQGASRVSKRPWEGQPDAAACNFAAGHLFQNLPGRFKAEGRVHAETCLAAIGAIAGFAAQHALFARLKETNDTAALKLMHLVKTKSGSDYVFGEPLNRMLMADSQSDADCKLWPLAAGGAVAAGLDALQLPKPEQMFTRVAKAIGGEREGMPSVPEQHFPKLPVKQLLQQIWPLAMMCFNGRFPNEPREFGVASTQFWPAIAAHVSNALIRQMQPALDPGTGLVIVMESAIYASKLAPVFLKRA